VIPASVVALMQGALARIAKLNITVSHQACQEHSDNHRCRN